MPYFTLFFVSNINSVLKKTKPQNKINGKDIKTMAELKNASSYCATKITIPQTINQQSHNSVTKIQPN